MQCNTYNTIQCNTTQDKTRQDKTRQDNTIKYNTTRYGKRPLQCDISSIIWAYFDAIRVNSIRDNNGMWGWVNHSALQQRGWHAGDSIDVTVINTIQHDITQYDAKLTDMMHCNTIQCNTKHHDTTQHITTQHSTTQSNSIRSFPRHISEILTT